MSLKNALCEALATATGDVVYAIVAAHAATPPYHVVEVVDQDPAVHFGGASGAFMTNIAVESFHTTAAAADVKADVIETALNGAAQQIGTNGDQMRITSVQTGRTDILYSPQDASRGFIYSVRQAFTVWHPN